jgi:hypothetical protein
MRTNIKVDNFDDREVIANFIAMEAKINRRLIYFKLHDIIDMVQDDTKAVSSLVIITGKYKNIEPVS